MSSDFDFISYVAERKIQEAVEEGKFDDLPGKGKPLNFDDDGLPFHVQMMNKVLKNAGVLPEWIQTQKDLFAEQANIEAFRIKVIEENQKRKAQVSYLPANHPELLRYQQWHARSQEKYLKSLKAVNSLIVKLSLIAPQTIELPGLYKVDKMMAQFAEEFSPLSPEEIAPPEPSRKR
jgi:hypothetical protein